MRKISVSLILILALLFSVTACSESASQAIEQGEATVEYLTGEFAQKLEKDGAEIYKGKITDAEFLSGNTGRITFVELKEDKNSKDDKSSKNSQSKKDNKNNKDDNGSENGEKEKPREILLDSNVQVAYVTNSSPDGAVMDGKEFVKTFVSDSKDTFTIFVQDDKVVLLLSAELLEKPEQ